MFYTYVFNSFVSEVASPKVAQIFCQVIKSLRSLRINLKYSAHNYVLNADYNQSSLLLTKLGSSFHIIGYVKPNANLKHVTLSVKLELKNFNKHDVVVLCGGSLDVARNDTMKGLFFCTALC